MDTLPSPKPIGLEDNPLELTLQDLRDWNLPGSMILDFVEGQKILLSDGRWAIKKPPREPRGPKIRDLVLFLRENWKNVGAEGESVHRLCDWVEHYEATSRIRPEVVAFALLMEEKLSENDDKGGWLGEDFAYLFMRLRQEMLELEKAYLDGQNVMTVQREAADVANFAMMISEVYEIRRKKRANAT